MNINNYNNNNNNSSSINNDNNNSQLANLECNNNDGNDDKLLEYIKNEMFNLLFIIVYIFKMIFIGHMSKMIRMKIFLVISTTSF